MSHQELFKPYSSSLSLSAEKVKWPEKSLLPELLSTSLETEYGQAFNFL